ncbi:hypothetical protein [Bradyrhizobium sp. CB3481]|uniref:hypothetical protein n=1 Tax=Bradyrhizobium sp. CB3481 TaxID=3039158 RepID=UPI0024B0DC71|nr:hypothetical protein [Bradyrhizobium sp. CB3481]WFU18984.1 hypothetical protein QA643_11895 [Bradyrhizobium sp. CB3481]
MSGPDAHLATTSGRLEFRPILGLLLCGHVAACCISLSYAAAAFSGIVGFDKANVPIAILRTLPFAVVSTVFAIGRFSFGYFVGFYFYTTIFGYLWLIEFSLLPYNHPSAIISIFASALAFLAPALFITSPVRARLDLSVRDFDLLLSAILIFAAILVAVAAFYNFRLVGLSEIYRFREEIAFPAPLRYAIGITSNALLPFAFAGFALGGSTLRAGIVLVLMLLLYPVTLSKLALFAPLWLLFLAFLCRMVEARSTVILSLLLPTTVGLATLFLAKAELFPIEWAAQYFGVVNTRMIAMPSIALEVYNNYFSTHPLTHFCQINVLKLVIDCPYDEPLSILMKAYNQGAFNASLFATEGIASVGPWLAPLSAFGCGLVIAIGNRLSSGLPPQFIVLSGGILPQILLNVPLSTTLLTNGAGVLFLLWYVTPRSIFERSSPHS